ncbi:MAG: sulfate adenylyltransferase subunit CysD [Candidatus Omnitrophota bacterium]
MEILEELENQSIFIIREAYWQYRDKLAVLWSGGKDSTTMLYLTRKAFFGKVPLPVIHIDTSFKFKEIYKFRNKLVRKWNLNLIVARNEEALKENMSPEKGRFECCNALKTTALKDTIKKYGLEALLLAIRRDEHAIRAKERIFSPRDEDFRWDYKNQPLEMWDEFYKSKEEGEIHFRIHPMLSWREIDIWSYIKREKIPVINLYFAKKGKRYRSIGCKCCCEPIESNANTIDKIIEEIQETKIAERKGRAQDKEKAYMMEKLRALGYM